jgi:hypothetical protein
MPTTIVNLPPEMLYCIVESLVATNRPKIFALSDPTTKTLLALTRVNKSINQIATKLLLQRCLYLDNTRSILLFISTSAMTLNRSPRRNLSFFLNITSLYLKADDLWNTSVYLQLPAVHVRELFKYIGKTLRRLTVHIRFDGVLKVPDPRGFDTCAILQDAFGNLDALEEFVCLDSYPSFSESPNIWESWPSLKRIVLFDMRIDQLEFWKDIATHPSLHSIILIRPSWHGEVNIKQEYFKTHEYFDDYFDILEAEPVPIDRRITVVDSVTSYYSLSTENWGEMDPDEILKVETYTIPPAPVTDEGFVDRRNACYKWAERVALDGRIWDLPDYTPIQTAALVDTEVTGNSEEEHHE